MAQLARRLSFAIVLAALVACGEVPVGSSEQAITHGWPDGNLHPNVGAMMIRRDGTYLQVCSGTLIAPTVFLTAAHCTSYLEEVGLDAFVTFDSVLRQDGNYLAGVMHTHPDYRARQSDPHDIAVITFAAPVARIAPAALPALGALDALAERHGLADQLFTAVGYGLGERINGGGQPVYLEPDYRGYSTSSFNSIQASWLRLSQNPAKGDSGACFGDSGGPNFLGGKDSNLLVATTITGDAVCRATNVVYRLDSPSARAFLDPFLK